jgi:hypothetical protein
LGAVIVALLAAPATPAAGAPPAVDQYTQHLPTAGGGANAGPAGGNTPQARLDLLPKKTLAALKGPDGDLLAQIATAQDLGAPGSAGRGADLTSGEDRGFVGAVVNTLGTGPVLILLVAIIGVAVAGPLNQAARRRRSSAPG